MARQLGSKVGMAIGLAAALLGLSVTVTTASDQVALGERGVIARARVVTVHDDRSRADVDTVEVALEPSGQLVVLAHYRGQPVPGDEMTVVFDRDDPATVTEQGVGLWGAFELLMAFVGVAGLVSLPIEWRRIRQTASSR